MTTFVNLTPHSVNLPGRVIPPAEQPPAWGEVLIIDVLAADGIRVVRRRYGDVHHLPPPQPDVIYIVSAIVREMCPERADLASPGGVQRGSSGRVESAGYLVVNGAPA